MSDDKIKELFEKHACCVDDYGNPAMDKDEFTAALREALAEELAELRTKAIEAIKATGMTAESIADPILCAITLLKVNADPKTHKKHVQDAIMATCNGKLIQRLKEELAEAARLLDHTTAWASGHDRSCPFCRAAARFVAEHGKAITPPSSPPPTAPGTTPSISPSA